MLYFRSAPESLMVFDYGKSLPERLCHKEQFAVVINIHKVKLTAGQVNSDKIIEFVETKTP